jgi:hypothetical protein
MSLNYVAVWGRRPVLLVLLAILGWIGERAAGAVSLPAVSQDATPAASGAGATTQDTNRPEPAPVAADGEPLTRTVFHAGAVDIEKAEQRFSPALRAHRRSYRLGLTTRDQESLRRKMLELALRIEAERPADDDPEAADWLEVQQGAFAAAGQIRGALGALEQRYEVLSRDVGSDELAVRAVREAEHAVALERFAIAEHLHDKAVDLARSPAARFTAVLDRGRFLARRDGMETAVAYYLGIANDRINEEPELAREAHIRVAEEFYHAQRLQEAIDVLLEVERRYEGTPEAERARHMRKGWVKGPGE